MRRFGSYSIMEHMTALSTTQTILASVSIQSSNPAQADSLLGVEFGPRNVLHVWLHLLGRNTTKAFAKDGSVCRRRQ